MQDGGTAHRHPWELARADFFIRLACGQAAHGVALHVLDVGAGDGYLAGRLLARLPPGSSVTCLDAGYDDERLERLRAGAPAGLSFVRARPERSFDLVLLLDVLEHVVDDVGFLRAIASQSLRSGGAAIASVPAFPALFTQHDIDLGHHRRYTRSSLDALLTAAELSIVRDGSLFSSLLPVRGAQKALELMRGIRAEPAPAGLAAQIATDVGAWRGGALTTSAIASVLRADAALVGGFGRLGVELPGLSVWSLARRS